MITHLAVLSLHIFLLLIAAEASARYFNWYQRIRSSLGHEILRYGILGTSGIGATMVVWVTAVIVFGIEHRTVPSLLVIGLTLAFLASFLALLVPIWIIELRLSAKYVAIALVSRAVIAVAAALLIAGEGL